MVFTCGRSGSTLLIRMLNCLPRTVVWGEHGGSLKPLLNSYDRFREVADSPFVTGAGRFLEPVYDRQPVLSRAGMSIEWLNWFGAGDVDALFRQLIAGLFYPEHLRDRFARWGFKEIQYRESEDDLLRRLFPSLKAIVLYRNPAAVFASQFKNFAKNDDERLPRLLRNIEVFFQFAAQQAERNASRDNPALFIAYEEIAGEFERSLHRLQAFLDEDFSAAIADIGRDVERFGKRRPAAEWSGDPVADFAAWQKANGVKVPRRKAELIARHYETVVAATAGPIDVPGTVRG